MAEEDAPKRKPSRLGQLIAGDVVPFTGYTKDTSPAVNSTLYQPWDMFLPWTASPFLQNMPFEWMPHPVAPPANQGLLGRPQARPVG